MCIGFRVFGAPHQYLRLRFPGQPGVAQRAQPLVTPRLPQRLSATEGVDWLALNAAGAEIATGTATVSQAGGLRRLPGGAKCENLPRICPSLPPQA